MDSAPARGRRDDHGPVELTDLEKALCAPSADPGRYVGRGDNYEEPLYQWQVRAIVHVLRSLPVEQRMEAMGMTRGGEINDAPSIEPRGLPHARPHRQARRTPKTLTVGDLRRAIDGLPDDLDLASSHDGGYRGFVHALYVEADAGYHTDAALVIDCG